MTAQFGPADLERFIRSQQIDAVLVPMQVETPTVLAAAAALGVNPAQIIKTLLFLVQELPVVVIASGDAVVDRGPLGDRWGLGKKQVKLADAATVLRVTGYAVGGVPPFGHATASLVLLDERIRRWPVIYGGGGDDRTLLRLAPQELARVTQGEWVSVSR